MFFDIPYYLTIRPLEILFETIFFIAYRYIGKPFATIIALSIFVNILVFPLYKRADKLQTHQREREKAMEKRLAHIKKTFKGDERVMMTQAYYRICDYKPVYALRGASSLLLQIPFFIAAFRFLSGLELLKGMPSILIGFPGNDAPFYLIKDLGAPDGMLRIGSVTVNVLPVLMTLINIISGTIYSKGHLRKEKIQLYVTALVFLVLLYNSPSGLVVYWTCNNVISLFKNAVQKIIASKKALPSEKVLSEHEIQSNPSSVIYDRLFLASSFFNAIITGLYIPSNIISASSTEFINIIDIFNPSRYLVNSFCLGSGVWVIWIGIYYLFSSPKVRKVFSFVNASFCGMAVMDYMMSGSGLGIISSELVYDNAPFFGFGKVMLNILLLVSVTAVIFIVLRIKPIIVNYVIFAGCGALIIVSAMNIHKIGSDYDDFSRMYSLSEDYETVPEIKLSKNGKNVVVIMLDRALGPCVPFLIYERPDLIQKFDGFTFYYNTVSYGRATNFGMPPVFGGYEYTPYEMNKRDNELLKDKTDEALRVLPVLFSENGFGVTVMDPPLAGYSHIPDLSIYDDYPEINKYISRGKFINGSPLYGDKVGLLKRNLYYFGQMKSCPLFLQSVLYNDGFYNGKYTRRLSSSDEEDYSKSDNSQSYESLSISDGVPGAFLEWYTVLEAMPDITEKSENEKGEFLMMYNCTAHEPALLQKPYYTPEEHVDNTAFDTGGDYDLGGQIMRMDDIDNVLHYHVNMATMLKLGDWFDYLREQGLYDNTRIILVADHGIGVGLFDGFFFGKDNESCEWYMPLLMVKDYDEHGFNFSWDFMTNADACPIAVNEVIENPVNPFTGNLLDGHEKNDDTVRILTSGKWDIEENNGNVFLPGDWYTVNGTPYDTRNWEYLGYE